MENAWRMRGGCAEDAWRMRRGCVEDAWRIHADAQVHVGMEEIV